MKTLPVLKTLALCCVHALLLGGCLFDGTEPATYACSTEHPGCPDGYKCNGTVCVPVGTDSSTDGPGTDRLMADHAVDRATLDMPPEDGPRPEGPLTDGPKADSPTPDSGPDATQPDGPPVDMMKPDSPKPDTAIPDATPPDLKPPPDAKPAPDVKPSPDIKLLLDVPPTPDMKVLPDQAAKADGAGCTHPAVVKSCATDSQGIEWCTIPVGCFTMGSPTTESCRSSNETQHQVTLTHKFEIQATEVTQDQFYAAMGYKPSLYSSCGGTCPVETVNWYEAASYANALSTKMGKTACYFCTGSGASVTCSEATAYAGTKIYDCPGYRLPTEAEWEYAYRAGTSTAYYSGANSSTYCSDCTNKEANLDKIGWYCANSNKTQLTGQKAANAWGLYDMAGNVWEWCHDWYNSSYGSSAVTDPAGTTGSYRVYRGGGWDFNAYFARAAYRYYCYPDDRYNYLGLRLARSVP